MKKAKAISILLILAALVIIYLGIYINSISNPRTITIGLIDAFATFTKENFTPIQKSPIQDNYTASSTIAIVSETNETNNKYQRIIQNLNNTKTTTKYIQNKQDKKLFFQINSTKNTKDLFSAKYLIENSTKYSSISNITNKYVNNGSNNYFETLNKETTELTNLIHIYDQIILSLKENLKDDYFTTSSTTTTINNKKAKYNITTLSLSQTNILSLSNSILSSLKKDQTSSIILETIFPNFKNSEITKEDLNNIQNIKINIYTNVTYKIQKVEFILKMNKTTYTISYEFNSTNNLGYFIEDGRVIYIFNLEDISSGKKVNILSPLEKSIGQICLNQTSDKYELTIDLDDSKTNKIKGTFASTNIFQEDKTTFNNNTVVDLSINDLSKNTYINLNIYIESIITAVYTIEEDLSTAILKSSLTEVEQNQINTYLQNGIYKVFEYEEG